jgi:hypothetical protein
MERMSNNKYHNTVRSGFTLIEMLIVAPIVLLTIGAFITVIVNLTGGVIASRGATVITYNIQDALNRIEDDVKLSTTFLAENTIIFTGTGHAGSVPQGYDDGSAVFDNVGSNGNMLILNTLATTGNPLVATSGLIYLSNLPNACNSTQAIQNTPMTLNIVYFVRNNTLWRRTVMPSNYASAGCNVPWQQPSCNPALFVAGSWGSNTFCGTQDIDLVDNINAGGFSVSYFNGAAATISNTVASDTSSSVANRNTALQSLSTVSASIVVNTTIAGRPVSQSGSIRSTKLDINASTIAPVVTTTTPTAPLPNASLSTPNQVVFTWPTAPGATGYTFQYQANGTGGAWTTAFTNSNTTTYTVTGNHTDVIYGRVSATNSAGTSSYSSNVSLTIPLWATPVMQNGWIDYGGAFTTAGYTKTSSGMVMLKGLIKAGTASSTTALFQLPVGYRPAYNFIYQNDTNSVAGRVDIYKDGTVRFQIGSNAWFSLDNISFMPSGVGTWNNLSPLYSGWINGTDPTFNNPIAYLLDSAGRVRLKGYITSGTTTSPTTIVNTPTAIVPPKYMHVQTDAGNANAHFGIDPSSGVNAIVAKGYSNAWISVNALYYPSTYPSSGACTVAWCAFSYQNSWHDYSAGTYSTGAYTKGTDGVVQLKGLLSTSGAIGTTIAQLPVGYRPKQQLLIAVESNTAMGRLDIDTSGNLISTAGSNVWFSVDSVSFLAEQ